MAPEPPGLSKGQVEGESGQEIFSPMHLTSTCKVWDCPPAVLPKYIWQLSGEQPFLSPPFFSPPCLLSSCPQSAAEMAMLRSRLRINAVRCVFPRHLASCADLFPTNLNLLPLARYPPTQGQGPGHWCRGSSEEHTPAPSHADRSSMPVVVSPWIIGMEHASSCST